MTDPVDELLDEARAWTPSPEETHAVVRSTVAVHHARARARRAYVLSAVLGAAALVATGSLALRGRDGTHRGGEPVQLGPSVTMVTAPRTSVVLSAQTETLTALELEAGTIALELHHPVGRAAQVLRVRAHDVEVRATGTVFAVTVRASGEVQVITRRGEVEVRTSSRSWSVGEGQAWPAGATWSEVAALFEALEGHPLLSPRSPGAAAPSPAAPVESTTTAPDVTAPSPSPDEPTATPSAVHDARGASASPDDAPDAAIVGLDAATEDAGRDESPEGRWQRARLLRAQGDPASALEDLSALVAARDPTWSPMALLESMRIYESVTGAPERVLELGLEFARDHRRHSLWPEARKMTCRAAEQLDRDDVDVCQDER